jgi:hypothetical protein
MPLFEETKMNLVSARVQGALCRLLRGSIICRLYPPFPARMRSPSGWTKLSSRLRRFILVVGASSLRQSIGF